MYRWRGPWGTNRSQGGGMGSNGATHACPLQFGRQNRNRCGVCGRRHFQKTPTEKGKKGEIWVLFFSLLDLRKAQLGIAKVTSHLEEVAIEAVNADVARICDILGNAFVDEVAGLAATRLRPSPVECKNAESIHKTAFLICLRLAFTQARVWELTNDSLIYEAPPEFAEIDLDLEASFQQATDDMAAKITNWKSRPEGKT